MNALALVAILSVAYSVADECKLKYTRLEDYEHKLDLMRFQGYFNKSFDNLDMVLYYKYSHNDSEAGTFYPSVLLSRKPRTRATFFIYTEPSLPIWFRVPSPNVEKSNLTEFAKYLKECKSKAQVIHIDELLPPE